MLRELLLKTWSVRLQPSSATGFFLAVHFTTQLNGTSLNPTLHFLLNSHP